jgi:hypothetical protein
MSLQHYLPASYLGRFSHDSSEPKRDRTLWVVEKRAPKIINMSAARVCAANDLYDVGIPENPNVIDDMWSSYEPELGAALDLLISRQLDAKVWATTLVQFVSALLVRGP